ncbi:unnamed protein product [Rotaria sp. Silwood2]|nr:unnamed protein product [Rotaria sp. Silwood2]CAF2926932.1 unnamed protein product [Rotaria sp. Silwood2]CAF3091698.1 unnamed protein product [Rotaria sp. Silwood2]CAF3917281.1 unnamed protein product [Rotaria sp. Silwood2]CAF4181527.1 unnamed protein product [Rotaria sp. Silwood2]
MFSDFFKSFGKLGTSNIEHQKDIECQPLQLSDTTQRRHVHCEDEFIVQLTLIWLDESANEYSFDSLRTKALLRDISNNNCLFIDDANEFQRIIEKMKREQRKILVVISESVNDWYIKDSFVYRLINRAFRTEDITLWYLFRYFVIDLCKQLEKVHTQQNNQKPFTVYRGQSTMSTNELKKLRSNPDCQIATNGFFSTSKDKSVARQFIADA